MRDSGYLNLKMELNYGTSSLFFFVGFRFVFWGFGTVALVVIVYSFPFLFVPVRVTGHICGDL